MEFWTKLIGLIFSLLLVCEIVFALSWRIEWFDFALRAFRTSIKYSKIKKNGLSITKLKNNSKNIILGGLSFKQITDTRIAFREILFDFSFLKYSPIMFGNILISKNEIIIEGRLFWTAFGILLLSIISIISKFYFIGLILFSIILILYLIHIARMMDVSNCIKEIIIQEPEK